MSTHKLNYIQIKAFNKTWILNRISSLIRRKKYNMEEVSISFDDQWFAHILIWLIIDRYTIEQIISQIEKLHDVIEIYDASKQINKILTAFYVHVKDEQLFKEFEHKPSKIINSEDCAIGIFILDLPYKNQFTKTLIDWNYKFTNRIISLI